MNILNVVRLTEEQQNEYELLEARVKVCNQHLEQANDALAKWKMEVIQGQSHTGLIYKPYNIYLQVINGCAVITSEP